MTIRFVTVEGNYKILEVNEVEIEPVTNVDMTIHNGVLHAKERP